MYSVDKDSLNIEKDLTKITEWKINLVNIKTYIVVCIKLSKVDLKTWDLNHWGKNIYNVWTQTYWKGQADIVYSSGSEISWKSWALLKIQYWSVMCYEKSDWILVKF